MRRLLYIAYYLKKMNWVQLNHFLRFHANRDKVFAMRMFFQALIDSWKYKISILEYFQFRFISKDHQEKLAWAGTGFMFEYQLKMNPPTMRDILDDKRMFFKKYGAFMIHHVADLATLQSKSSLVEKLLTNPSGKIVFKGATGKCGAQVEIREVKEFNQHSLVEYLMNGPYDLVEEFIIQHPALNALSPSAVNTVRVFTQLNDNHDVDILGCRLRVSINSPVDNLAAGNIAAPIDEVTGVVSGPGVYSDIARSDEVVHPITGKPILGFVVPYWDEVLDLVKNAALAYPQNRSIGWDVVITENGPGLIEGNHDWCKLLWQLPVKQGLKPLILKYYQKQRVQTIL